MIPDISNEMAAQRVVDGLCRRYRLPPVSVFVMPSPLRYQDGDDEVDGLWVMYDCPHDNPFELSHYGIFLSDCLWWGGEVSRLHIILHEFTHHLHYLKHDGKGAVHGALFRRLEKEVCAIYGLEITHKSSGYVKDIRCKK